MRLLCGLPKVLWFFFSITLLLACGGEESSSNTDGDMEADQGALSERCKTLLGYDESINACEDWSQTALCEDAKAKPDMAFLWSFYVRGDEENHDEATTCAEEYYAELGLEVVEDADPNLFGTIHLSATAAAIEPLLHFTEFSLGGVYCLGDAYCDCAVKDLEECEASPWCVQWPGVKVDYENDCSYPEEPVGCITSNRQCITIEVFGLSPDGECYMFDGCRPDTEGWEPAGIDSGCGADGIVMWPECE